MKGKVVLVTGATGGLGRSVTETFLEAGAKVAGVARSISASDFNHPEFMAFPAEISSSASANGLVKDVIARAGRVDVLAHLVGGFAGGQTVAETADATWEQMLTLNVTTAFYMFRAMLPHMQKARSGRILAIASRAALEPGPGVGAYSASKAALVSLVHTVALENKGKGITANAILPATIDTAANRTSMPSSDFSTWIQPRTIASLLLWLSGDAGAQVTGAAIPVYGGQL
jgi:NAD(P)-dependent dehydrogenase (short-subunit alcohol dehydrogenase family)